MSREVMRVLGAVFFVSMGLFVLLAVIAILSPSTATGTLGKFLGVLFVLWLGSLLMMIGGLILARFDAPRDRTHGGGFAG